MIPAAVIALIVGVAGSILFVIFYDSTTYDEVLEVKKQLAEENYELQRSIEKNMNQYYLGEISDEEYLKSLYELRDKVDKHILKIQENIDNAHVNLTYHDASKLQVRVSGEIAILELNLLE